MISDTNFEGGQVTARQTHSGLLVSVAYGLLVLLGAIALLMANLLIWVDSTIISTAGFTQTIERALDKPEVQQRTADVLAERVVQSEEVQQRLTAELPPTLATLTRAAEPQLEALLSGIILRILETEFSGDLRNAVIDRLHSTVVAVLEDEDAPVQAQGNSIVLDLHDVALRLFDRLGIAPPERVQQADFGQVVLVDDATGLKQASFFVRHHTELVIGTLIVAALLFGAAILFSRDHLHGVRLSGYAIAGAGVLTLLLVWGGNLALEAAAEERTVIRELVRSLEVNLKLQSLALLILGVCLIAVSDRRILAGLQSMWSKGGAAVEEFGAARAALIVIGGSAVILLLV